MTATGTITDAFTPSANRTWCTNLACLNSRPYHWLDAPCPESGHPHRPGRQRRPVLGVDGHAMTARHQITDGQVLPGIPA
ncbi:hypothetical protein GCM10010317_093150 [Streptomyces mirabilis]|uniref:hypothetical protein n=1 Tax=Streptomyces mirabilis TaxID=68239 RepID=UPI00167E621F|nr:hypothetical protein [Streptomyces mirabilis]GHD76494.1 hypothetical protein GCM10010317_093150 [Streptomyces mirabilis]